MFLGKPFDIVKDFLSFIKTKEIFNSRIFSSSSLSNWGGMIKPLLDTIQ